ncbi:hypothetical protein BAE44_0007103 [Dichanthelium oligosanthes]|uniref:DUF1677 domain-containing protein n=1 Tax=Dichanthelium oligosanthes TaxID=888268 RepID=A0A1E5W3G8_9POAL|nr:hypothetical protein BAE44_0007103 [Dichanthelium oligosanthes]
MDSAATTEGGGAGEEATTTATCACCGIGEECTVRYLARVAAQFAGAWVCGLCAEAIKDEAARRGVGIEAATRAHAEFVGSAAGAGSAGPAVQVAQALLQLFKKVMAAAPGAAVLTPATPAAGDLGI